MIDGNKITELDVNDYRKHIGITMQEAYFFDDTIEKNIDISKKLVDCLEKCLICRHIRRFAD